MLSSGGITAFSLHSIKTLALFGIGAIIMRAAGCVINDLWDRDLDKMVERTKTRPLASGIVSPKQGLAFLATLLLIGFIVLLQFNKTTIILGVLSLPLIASYPLMKRITWWPQAFLGLTFNFSALMGWSAITGHIAPPAILLYIGGIFWTIGYDTIYAHQDKEDDLMAGIKSTARLFEGHSRKFVAACYIIAIILIALTLFSAKGLTPQTLLIALPALHLAKQITTWKPENHASSLAIFKSNHNFGFLVLALCAL